MKSLIVPHLIFSTASHVEKLKKDAELGKLLKSTFLLNDKAKARHSLSIGRKSDVSELQQAPNLSMFVDEQIIPNFVPAWLSDVGFPFMCQNLAASCPSKKALSGMLLIQLLIQYCG